MNDLSKRIRKVTIPTNLGPCHYTVDEPSPFSVSGAVVYAIDQGRLTINGDPIDHYLGYDDEDNIIFSINCMIPCTVEYFT